MCKYEGSESDDVDKGHQAELFAAIFYVRLREEKPRNYKVTSHQSESHGDSAANTQQGLAAATSGLHYFSAWPTPSAPNWHTTPVLPAGDGRKFATEQWHGTCCTRIGELGKPHDPEFE